nr:MAG TPA: hypothetical protein [Caudoviricetes sp.]
MVLNGAHTEVKVISCSISFPCLNNPFPFYTYFSTCLVI